LLIFFKARIVLFAVEKTGTTALQSALEHRADVKFLDVDTPVEKHTGFAEYKAQVEPGLLDKIGGPLDYVGVFREPVSWLFSWYRYRLRDEDADMPQSTRGISFERFAIDFCLKPYLRPPHAWVKAQSVRVCDSRGAVGVNRLFRYEDMASLIRFLEMRLEMPITLERENVSPPSKDLYLSHDTLALYKQTFSRDFEIYESLPLRGF